MDNDNFLSKNKILFIAKYNDIKYIIFNDICGDVNSKLIHTELISVNTGEIIWNKTQFLTNTNI